MSTSTGTNGATGVAETNGQAAPQDTTGERVGVQDPANNTIPGGSPPAGPQPPRICYLACRKKMWNSSSKWPKRVMRKRLQKNPKRGRASHDLRNTRSYGRIGDLRDPRRTSPSLQPEVQCTTPHRLTPGDVPQIAHT